MIIDRSSGILLHITSLPGAYGIGTLGKEAFQFVDFLKKAGQKYWQILPIGPINPALGYSPYSSPSTFAGSYLFISLEELAKEEWFSTVINNETFTDEHFVYFDKVIKHKLTILKTAVQDFFKRTNILEIKNYEAFCQTEQYWLADYALFSALSEHFGTDDWLTWDAPFSTRDKKALEEFSAQHADDIRFHQFIQYIFFKQWAALKKYCNENEIFLIGDIPIYITLEGADAWAHPEILQIDEETGIPAAVSGVPPDYFSETGQRWGNPLYKWFSQEDNDELHRPTLTWWARRIAHLHKLVDIVRVDHFRGFESYWAIPTEEETAIKGTWLPGPGIDFFLQIRKEIGDLPLIAEDLGIITPEVEKLRDDLGLPGMKILQFAFDFNNKNYYLPHNITNPNCILYTGTHDNNTTNGWFYGNEVDEGKRDYILEYLGSESKNDLNWQLIRQAYRSVANLVIFPAQDILGYGHEFRMNTPGTSKGNWGWKLTTRCLNDEHGKKLKRLGELYNRLSGK